MSKEQKDQQKRFCEDPLTPLVRKYCKHGWTEWNTMIETTEAMFSGGFIKSKILIRICKICKKAEFDLT